MFGEYAQVASYIQPALSAAYQNDELYQGQLPAYLRPTFYLPHPWNQGRETSGLSEDFIMIAEFSELEGPKPLMTIPKDGGADFDQNTFAVRILAVDHQSPTDGFSISEDAQVLLCDSEAGVFAFVHHLVLYDNSARGFVRPYCIAFITTDQRKLMYFYDELSRKFKKVARFLKYGNKMVFVGDLERHLKDLEYTKNVLLSQVGKMRLRNPEGPQDQILDIRKNAENELYRGLQTIQQSSLEIKDILSVLKPLLPDRSLEARFRILEDRAHKRHCIAGLDKLSLPESGFTDGSATDNHDTRYGSLSEPRISPLALFKPKEYKPVLVETKKAKRFNVPLRGLHELCSWGAREGLKKLRHIHMYFKRDMTILELEKNESRLLCPHSTSINHGHCVTGNFLSGVQMKTSLNATEEAEKGWSMLYSHQWGSLGSLDSQESFKSVDSSPSPNFLTEASPSSFLTYDSQSGHAFLSASASPENEISLLMSNEYYPDMTTNQNEEMTYIASNASCKSPLNDEVPMTGAVNKIMMLSNNKCCQDHLISSSGSGDHCADRANISDTNAISSSQDDSQILSREMNFNHKCTTPDSSQHSLHSNSDMKVKETHMYYPFSNNESTQGNETPNFVSNSDVLKVYSNCPDRNDFAYKTQIFNTLNESNFIKIQHENAEVTLQERKDVTICEDGDVNVITHNSHDGICQGRPVTAQSFIISTSENNNLSNEDNGGLAYNTTQSLSINPKCFPENIGTVDGHDATQNEKKEQLSPGQINPGPEDSRSGSSDNPGPLKEHLKPHQIQRRDSLLSLLLEQEQNQRHENKGNVIPWSSQIAPGLLQKDSETQQTSLCSLRISVNGGHCTGEPVDKLHIEKSNQPASDGNISTTSKLSHSHLTNSPQFAHHITRVIHAQNEKSSHSGLDIEDDLDRARTESDTSSAFTEISMQDLYPHLMGLGKFKLSALCDESETADVNDECTGIPTSRNTALWKPRCSLYTVGDWINNLTQGRPGFGLSEVLSTYQYFDHVIFSLLSGRPVLVAGSAKMETEVIKIVGALAVFVPVTRRNYNAVLEWTTKPLKITDFIKLKLVGVCRPDRRSLESYIPGAIKKACTVIDIEKRTIVAPPYQGQFITALISKRKGLKSDVQLLAYIGWWLMDILAKAFIFFHSFCLEPAGCTLYSLSPKDQRDAHHVTVSIIMAKLGVRECDGDIIEHLAELIKLSKLEPHIWQGTDSGSMVSPLTLQQKICEKFRC